MLCSFNAIFSDSQEISKPLLLKNVWGPEAMSLGYYIEFQEPNKYVKNFGGPGSWQCSGTFQIASGKLLLSRGEFDPLETPRENMNCESMKCQLVPDNKSLYRNLKLSCDPSKYEYFLKSATATPGMERKVDAQRVVTMGTKTAILKTAMKVRVQPNSKAQAYFLESMGTETTNRDSLPEKHEITLLARSLKKDKVGSSENYWYFADLDLELSYCARLQKEKGCRSTGWIFGEWLEIQQ